LPVSIERPKGMIVTFHAVIVKTPAIKAELAHSLAFRRRQKLGGYDLVGVDVIDRQVEGRGFHNT
jgi:hypothetical protein